MNQYVRHLLSILICTSALQLQGFDNAHFYRATNFFLEPRLERDYLTTVDVFAQAGSTSKGRDKEHETVKAFDIWGEHDMHELAVGVPCKDLSNPLDLIIQQLSSHPSRCVTSKDACKKQSKFATYSICADFSISEVYLSFAQNFNRGFFMLFYLPIRRMKVDNISFCDISPKDATCPNINTPIWQLFKDNFCEILDRHCLSAEPISATNLGDVSIDIGWTHSFQRTEVIDFVDTTFKFGILIPSGQQKCEDQLFSFPSGYNGHTGFEMSADLAFGAFDWLTLGSHFDALVFTNKTRDIRLKTGKAQSGIIKLAKGCAKIERGSQWMTGAYIKFDHFVRGLSLLLGYSFVNKGRDSVCPLDTEKFNVGIANSDHELFGYKMHTLNFQFEYDFAHEDRVFGPRISAYYNMIVGGKRIFTTDVGGANIGLELAWDL